MKMYVLKRNTMSSFKGIEPFLTSYAVSYHLSEKGVKKQLSEYIEDEVDEFISYASLVSPKLKEEYIIEQQQRILNNIFTCNIQCHMKEDINKGNVPLLFYVSVDVKE